MENLTGTHDRSIPRFATTSQTGSEVASQKSGTMKHSSLSGQFLASLWLVWIGPILAIAEDRATVVCEKVKVAMRDGVLLATDIYRVASVEKTPVLLMRTPYN